MHLKAFAKRLLPHLPRWAQQVVRQRAEQQRLAQHVARKQRTKVQLSDVVLELERFEFGTDIMVHGSISNIGKMDRPVPALVDELLRLTDIEHNTLLVPALPYNTTMKEYLDGLTGFDIRNAKNAMGAISNLVMAMPGAQRSLHPTHSVAALGPKALEYTQDHQLDATPFGPHSPYAKLTMRRGKILLFGVGLNSVTCFHVYEDLLGTDCPMQVYLPDRYTVPCTDQQGREISLSTVAHNPQLSAVRDCERARPWLEKAGAIRSVPLGESELCIIDAWLFTRTLLEHLKKGESIYGKVKLKPEHIAAIQRRLKELEQPAS